MIITRAIIVAAAVATWLANYDRVQPPDPFGGNTIDMQHGPLLDSWRTIRQELEGDHALLGACVDSTVLQCGASRTLWAIISEAREQQGLSLIGHVNRAINLSITPSEPSEWLTGLDAIDAKGDCKAYATAKYFALRELGIPASHVRLLILRARNRVEDHMVVAVYFDREWLILDNLTLALVRDTDEVGYMPLFVLDDSGVRFIQSS